MEVNEQILFRLGEEEYGVDVFSVEEIVRNVPLQPPPTPSKHIAGMIEHRGTAVPVYNLRARFGLPDAPVDQLVVVWTGGVKIALAVDQVSEMLNPEETEVQEAPALLRMAETAYVSNVVRTKGRLVVLLDVEALLTEGEKEKVEAMLQTR